MKRKIIIIVVIAGLLTVVTVILAVAYNGPTLASDPSKDYSDMNRPASEVQRAGHSYKGPTDTQAAISLQATPTTSANVSNSSAPGNSGSTPAAVNSNTHSAVASNKSSTTSKSDSLVQGLVDVISHMQL